MIRDFLSLLRRRWKLTLAVLIVFAVVGLTVFVVGVTAWEYTNSTEFCGTTCHTMPPEYVAYQQSPHARVSCVDCHLGQEGVLQAIPRKAAETRHVVFALTQDYELPIYVKNLRPARDTCEQCHNPDKFSNDTIKEIQHFENDEHNTERSTILSLKTGGGSHREGLGKGIHWHIENEVYYLATDKLKQTIPYVRMVDQEGNVTEYFDLAENLPPGFIEQNEENLRRMDCIDCHNRVSHEFKHPETLVDDALSKGQIDPSIPYIRARAVQILSTQFESHVEAEKAIQSQLTWYQQNYPDYMAENEHLVREAMDRIQRLYTESIFPEMEIGWLTHPDNLGHDQFPGCFRCHDGKHTSPQGETIRLECNICHSIPRQAGPGLPSPIISLESGTEPNSHKDSNWIARHRDEFDETCAGCHSVFNRGGADNSSFCANAACHGITWEWAGLDAPGLREYLPDPESSPADTSSGDTTHTDFIPEIPHPLDEQRIGQCLTCHGPDGFAPYTAFHAIEDFPLDACTECHEVAPNVSQ